MLFSFEVLESHVEGQMFRFELTKSAFDRDKHTVTRLHVTTRGLKNSQAFNCFLKIYNNQAE